MSETEKSSGNSTARWAMGISIIAVIMAFASFLSRPEPKSSASTGLSEASKMKIHGEGTLNVGYIGTPPFVVINTKAVKDQLPIEGMSVDLFNEIALRANPHIKMKWIQTTKDSLAQDLLNGKIDIVADPIVIDINRSSSCGFTNPLCFFGIAHAVMRSDDNRVNDFEDLNNPALKISVEPGSSTAAFARSHFDKPKILDVAAGDESPAKTQVDDVAQGRVDVALLEGYPAIRQAAELGGKVKVLWINSPPSLVPVGFATRLEDHYLRGFINTCLADLEAEGFISELEEHWSSIAYYKTANMVPGSGIARLFQASPQAAPTGASGKASAGNAPSGKASTGKAATGNTSKK